MAARPAALRRGIRIAVLERGPHGDFVAREWTGKTVVCIATGPSVTAAQIALVRAAHEAGRVKVIAVNDAYLLAPFADILFFADKKWLKWHLDGIARKWLWCSFSADEVRKAFAGFRGQKCTIRDRAEAPIFTLKNLNSERLSTNPTGLHTGGNSGHMALNLAFLAGGNQILLVGYDGKRGPRDEKHGFGEHPDKTEPPYKDMARNFSTTEATLREAGVAVINCTPGSAIKCFPMKTLDECLALGT